MNNEECTIKSDMSGGNGKVFDIRERSFQFSVGIVRLVADLPKTTAGFAIGNQIVRSGTSVGANIEEAQNAGTKKEFIRGLTISLKEARETDYWLRLLFEAEIGDKKIVMLLTDEIKQLIKILTTIIKNAKNNSR